MQHRLRYKHLANSANGTERNAFRAGECYRLVVKMYCQGPGGCATPRKRSPTEGRLHRQPNVCLPFFCAFGYGRKQSPRGRVGSSCVSDNKLPEINVTSSCASFSASLASTGGGYTAFMLVFFSLPPLTNSLCAASNSH